MPYVGSTSVWPQRSYFCQPPRGGFDSTTEPASLSWIPSFCAFSRTEINRTMDQIAAPHVASVENEFAARPEGSTVSPAVETAAP
jgi:hypothetical protein